MLWQGEGEKQQYAVKLNLISEVKLHP